MNSIETPVPDPVLLLVNGHSRRGRQMFGEAVAALRAMGVEVKESHLARDRADTERLLRREVAEGAKCVVVGGGDGTLSNCAGYLVHSDVAMGILPLGTGNTFARSLGVPLDIEGAVRTIAGGHVESIDVGKCNNQVFLNSVSLGLSAEIAGALTPQLKSKMGLLSWPIIGARLGLTHRAMRVRLSSNERQMVIRTHQLMIANGRYVAGPIKASRNASVQDNELTVFALGGERRGELLEATWQWLRHHHVESREVPFFETQNLRVESLGRPLHANVDGDINETTPLHIEVLPRALRVVVPDGFQADAV